MWFLIICVCECFLLFDVFVCIVRDVWGDVVRLVFLCVLSVFVRFVVSSVAVRFTCDV